MKPSNARIAASFWLLVIFSLSAFAADPAGRWKGAIEIPGSRLEVEVDLESSAGAWKGDITIPAQGARDLPLEAVAVEGSQASFRIAGVPGEPTFKGELSSDGNTLSGSFTQGGQSFPFSLSRGDATDHAAKLQPFDKLVSEAIAAWHVPGVAIAVIADGKVVHAKGYGMRDVENGLPMTADTLLPIGSSTKAFTTFAIGTLVDEGKVEWDEPVGKYLHWFRLTDPNMTAGMVVRDLVTHRSGYPRHDLIWYNNDELNRRELVESLAHVAPSAPVRARFQYNNLMYLTAGHLIEELTGKRWEDAVRERILAPLGMTRTNFADSVSAIDPDHARGYRRDDDKTILMPFREVGEMGPAGSINSTINEMSRWVRMLLASGTLDGKKLIEPVTWDELRTPQVAIPSLPRDPQFSTPTYAHGWFVDSYRGHLRTHHGGNIDGFSALVTLFPNDGVGIVALSNANGTPIPNLMTLHAADLLFDLSGKDWNAEALARREKGEAVDKEAEQKKTAARVKGTKPSHAITDYAGDYRAPGYGLLRVEHASGKLAATYNRIATPLEHWHYDVFNGLENPNDPVFEDMKYHFQSDLNGNVSSVRVAFEPNVEPIVFHKEAPAWMSDPAELAKFTGEYELGPQTITVSVRGSHLVVAIQGQPPYELVPGAGGWFDFEKLDGFRIRFPDAATMELHQPNGLFTAKRK